ncbi:unnamed protein product [Brassica rapa subsp. narinosa]
MKLNMAWSVQPSLGLMMTFSAPTTMFRQFSTYTLSQFLFIREGLHYNPYFSGGEIAMPKMLNDEAVEYEDGTPATEAQMGKDVVSFLSWAVEPEMEERKLIGRWVSTVNSMECGLIRLCFWFLEIEKTEKALQRLSVSFNAGSMTNACFSNLGSWFLTWSTNKPVKITRFPLLLIVFWRESDFASLLFIIHLVLFQPEKQFYYV